MRISGQDHRRSPGRYPRPKKSLGQHFLVEGRFVARIIEAAEVSPADLVVEVGPGRGIVTRALAERARQVLAVELDAALANGLAQSFRGRDNVRVVHEDAREVDIDALVARGEPYKVVANLPYYAASPIVRRFLEAEHKPALMAFMVQREVAHEMAACPGRMGLLSVAVQLYGETRVVCHVPPRAFRPVPRVTSAIVRIEPFPAPSVAFDSEEGFFRLVKAGFSAPRKQLRNSLSGGLGMPPVEAEEMLAEARIDQARRAQTLSLPEWGSLYEAYQHARQ